MKALVATAYGQPDQLSIADIPVPRPGPGQLQVRVAAATINPTDIRAVAGDFGDAVQLEFPYVLGNDFAGTVTEVGAGVSEYRVGDEVFGQAMPRQLAFVAAPTRPSLSTGALAEYAVFEADTPLLAHRPPEVSAEQAAALAIVGVAARAVTKTADIQAGETVLVIGATGGVGTAVLPLLAAAGARVVATADTPAHGEELRRIGADEIVGFDEAEFPDDVDVVLNLVLFSDRLAAAARPLRPGGRLVTIIYPSPSADELGRDDIDLHFVMDMEGRHGGMRDVAESAASGLLVATIGERYGLDDAVEAAVAYARRTSLGKVVVTF
jgi:NADPH:quinone reductase-like Zn-dependent oxidoreductase